MVREKKHQGRAGCPRDGNVRNFEKEWTLMICTHLVQSGARLCWELNRYMWDLVTVLKTHGEGNPTGLGILNIGYGWKPHTEHWCDLKAVCGMAVHTRSPEDSSTFCLLDLEEEVDHGRDSDRASQDASGAWLASMGWWAVLPTCLSHSALIVVAPAELRTLSLPTQGPRALFFFF